MDRKICEKIMDVFENVFFLIFEWARPRTKLGWDRPE